MMFLSFIACFFFSGPLKPSPLPQFLQQQIVDDLQGKSWSQKEIDASWSQLKDQDLFLRCKIVQHTIYIQANETTKNNARYWILRDALEKLVRNKLLSSLDCIISLKDRFDGMENSVPILAFSAGGKAINVALIPDCEALNPIDRRYLIHSMQKASKAYPWPLKKPTVFWRGTPTGRDERDHLLSKAWENPRHLLVQMSLDHSNWVNAEFTHTYRASDYQKNEEGHFPVSSPAYWEGILPVSSPVHPKDHLLYRYLIDVDGHSTCFSRTYWILLSNSILFKQMTQNRQWFYQGLIPYVHFLPLKEDLSDLEEKYAWCLEHEQECLSISEQASQLAGYLDYETNLSYLLRLLQTYEKLGKSQPRLTNDDERDPSYAFKYAWYKLKRHLKKWTELPVANG